MQFTVQINTDDRRDPGGTGVSNDSVCTCMTEDLGDGYGERVVTHSSGCPDYPDPTERKY